MPLGVQIGPHLYYRRPGGLGELRPPSLSQQETASWLQAMVVSGNVGLG